MTDDSMVVVLQTLSRRSRCPQCQRATRRVHSRYQRSLAEVPVQGRVVRLQLQVRRFFCNRAACPQRIFCERLKTLAAPYARRTQRLTTALSVLGMAIGGKPGARVAGQLGMPTSRETLLRQLRRKPLLTPSAPRVVGIDDWAFKKGRRYGTIVVDLERRCPIDVLPDREATTVAQWLQTHPGVQVISRDRAGAYADGARQGSPEAVQVADRWHLLKNLLDAFVRFLTRHHRLLRRAAQAVTAQRRAATAPVARVAPQVPQPPAVQAAASRDRRLVRYREIRALVQQGVSQRAIARQLRLHRNTVRRFATAEEFPERTGRSLRPSRLSPWIATIQQRWTAGCHNAAVLWREVQAAGYRGGYVTVRSLVQPWRAALPTACRCTHGTPGAPTPLPFPLPSARTATWWVLHELLKNPDPLTPEQQAFVTQLKTLCPEVEHGQTLVLAFAQLLRQRQSEALASWLTAVRTSAVPELVSFATGLTRDLAAVQAACSQEWSNGQVEGQINRLKLLKRQMFGRANFDLLKARVLQGVNSKT